MFPANEIKKGTYNMKKKELDKEATTISWPVPTEKLPHVTMVEGVLLFFIFWEPTWTTSN
jgi:hypothetical protein